MIIETLAQIDESIFLTLHNIARGDFMNSAMWLSSGRFIWIPMYAALVWWIVRTYGWRRAAIVIAAIGLAVVCADQLCAKLIRPAVERMRPANPDNPLSMYVTVVNDYRGGSFGFPSCHAANTFALTAFVAMMCRSPRITLWLLFWAVLNCVSRIYLGVHYPGDILAGAIAGTLFGVAWWYGAKRVAQWTGLPAIGRVAASWTNPVLVVGVSTLVIIISVSFF